MGLVHVMFFGAVIEAARRQSETQVSASTVRELFAKLSNDYGGPFKEKLLDSADAPQPFVNVYVNNTDIRHLKELETPLKDGDEVLILPAVAGG